jgi:uncharacterized repeat protein (TIGR01451 family)
MYYEFVDANNHIIGRDKAIGVAFSGTTAQDEIPRNFTFDKDGEYTVKLRVRFAGKNVEGSSTGSCLKRVTVEPPCAGGSSDDVTTCLIMTKKASNDTQNIDDANGTTAKAGDVITYRLSVKNTSQSTAVKGFVIKENISDILEYADVVDLHDGTIDDKNTVSWDPVDIEPGQIAEKQITVKVKNPIPQTPVAASNPKSFDMVMTNVFYTSEVNIKLPPTVIKTTEQVTRNLPNTGPGEAIAVSVSITMIAGYFFARSRLMAKELDIVTNEYVMGG